MAPLQQYDITSERKARMGPTRTMCHYRGWLTTGREEATRRKGARYCLGPDELRGQDNTKDWSARVNADRAITRTAD